MCMNKISVWQHFLWFEFVLTSLTVLLSCQTVATKFELQSLYDLSTPHITLQGLVMLSGRYFLFTHFVPLQYVF